MPDILAGMFNMEWRARLFNSNIFLLQAHRGSRKDAIMNDPITPLVPAAPTLTAPPVTPHVEPHTKAGVSDSEAATIQGWIKDDLAKGKMTQAQADAVFNELNVPLDQRGPDTRTDEQKTLDKHFTAAKPEDYIIRYGGPGEDVPMTPELKQGDAMLRGWLAAMGFSREQGNAASNIVLKLAQQKMTPAQVESYTVTENAKLQALYGDTWDERFEPARRMIHAVEATNPGLENFLRANGVGDRAVLVNMLINHAPIYHARKGQGR